MISPTKPSEPGTAFPSAELHEVISAPKLSERLPSLDGWRAVSIIMVLGAHCSFVAGFPEPLATPFRWLFDGGLGVRFFFVISGFLITWLLLLEHDRLGRASLKAFYIRRAFRILPVYYAYLLVIALLQALTPYSQDARSWAGNLTFTTNFLGSQFTTAHLWSLSTEEQFYLLWPGLFVIFSVAAEHRRALRILAVPVLLAPLCRVIGYKSYPSFLVPLCQGFSFFKFFDSLAVGCAAAILLARSRRFLKERLEDRPRRMFGLGLTLILVPYVLMKLGWLRQLTVPFSDSAQAVGFASLLLLSVLHPEWRLWRALNWPLVARLGVLSYSIYIWHNLFCSPSTQFGLRSVWWMSFPGWLLPVLLVSFVSYYGLERPFLRLRARFRNV